MYMYVYHVNYVYICFEILTICKQWNMLCIVNIWKKILNNKKKTRDTFNLIWTCPKNFVEEFTRL